MGGYRAERVAELIHRELALRLPRDVKDHRLVPISITRVVVARDLGRAVAYYLPLGGGEAGEALAAALKGAGSRLRGPIGRALGIRHAPQIVFERDRHSEEAFRVTELIERVTRDLSPGKTVGEEE